MTVSNSEYKTYILHVGIALSALIQFKNKYNNNTTLHTVLQYISVVHEIRSINCSHNVAMKINISFFYSDSTACKVFVIHVENITAFILFFLIERNKLF